MLKCKRYHCCFGCLDIKTAAMTCAYMKIGIIGIFALLLVYVVEFFMVLFVIPFALLVMVIYGVGAERRHFMLPYIVASFTFMIVHLSAIAWDLMFNRGRLFFYYKIALDTELGTAYMLTGSFLMAAYSFFFVVEVYFLAIFWLCYIYLHDLEQDESIRLKTPDLPEWYIRYFENSPLRHKRDEDAGRSRATTGVQRNGGVKRKQLRIPLGYQSTGNDNKKRVRFKKDNYIPLAKQQHERTFPTERNPFPSYDSYQAVSQQNHYRPAVTPSPCNYSTTQRLPMNGTSTAIEGTTFGLEANGPSNRLAEHHSAIANRTRDWNDGKVDASSGFTTSLYSFNQNIARTNATTSRVADLETSFYDNV